MRSFARVFTTPNCLSSVSRYFCLISFLLLVSTAAAQQTITGTFQGAYQIVSGGSGSSAVHAQCPAQAPDSCSSIGASDWCCPSSNTCGWNGGSVGCCPWGQTCNSYAAGGQQWQSTTSYWQPTTTWQQQQTVTVYAQQSTYEQPQVYTTEQAAGETAAGQYNGYCSTEYAKGPGLPTQAQGSCGTILILEAGARKLLERTTIVKLLVGGVMLQVFAWTLILGRA